MKKHLFVLPLFFLITISFAQLTNSCVINNAGFESGNTSVWTFKSGGYGAVPSPCPSGCQRYGRKDTTVVVVTTPLNAPLTGLTNRHTLMSTAGGLDPNAILSKPVPVVAPGGGVYSFRLGNSAGSSGTVTTQSLAEAETARLTFLVNNQNAFFTYRYALFINNAGKHSYTDQPSFEVVVLDSNDVLLPCGSYLAVPGGAANCADTTSFIPGLTTILSLQFENQLIRRFVF